MKFGHASTSMDLKGKMAIYMITMKAEFNI